MNDADHHKVPVRTRHIVDCSRTNKGFSNNPQRRDRRSLSLVGVKDNKAERSLSDNESYKKDRRSNSHNEDTATKTTQIQVPDSIDSPRVDRSKENDSNVNVRREIKITSQDSDKDLKSKVNENIAKKLDSQKTDPEKDDKKNVREKTKKSTGIFIHVLCTH